MPQHCDDERVTKAQYPRSWQSEILVGAAHNQQVSHAWL